MNDINLLPISMHFKKPEKNPPCFPIAISKYKAKKCIRIFISIFKTHSSLTTFYRVFFFTENSKKVCRLSHYYPKCSLSTTSPQL